MKYRPSPVTVRLKAWVCKRLLARIAGSNPDEGMEIPLSLVNSRVLKVEVSAMGRSLV